jgi:hypothetical protein
MKRLLLVLVLAVALTGLLAAPASAFLAPRQHTAYITSYLDPGQWAQWNGPKDPLGLTAHPTGPHDPLARIPHSWNVVVTREWFDSRLGATLIPAEYFNTVRIARTHGGWAFAIKKAARGVRYWSRAYKFGYEAAGFVPAGTWARDWWVPLGKLAPGHYSGWVTQFAPLAFVSWMDWGDETANPPIPASIRPLDQPIVNQPADLNWTQHISFTVK